jgi:hypothetical protein
MSQQPTLTEQLAGYADNISLWHSQPLLKPAGQTYLGRVFVEVWDGEDTHLVATNDSLCSTALAALSGEQQSISATNTPLTNLPATGGVSGQTFVGRVIVEVWNNQIVIGVSGTENQVLQSALKTLQA